MKIILGVIKYVEEKHGVMPRLLSDMRTLEDGSTRFGGGPQIPDASMGESSLDGTNSNRCYKVVIDNNIYYYQTHTQPR